MAYANTQTKDNDRQYLVSLSHADKMTDLNAAVQQFPSRRDAKALDDLFLNAGAELLANSKTAQCYDRDTTLEMAVVGMQGFQHSMLNSEDMLDILNKLGRGA